MLLAITLLFSSGILAVPFNITLIYCNLHVIYRFVISFIAQQMQSDIKTISKEYSSTTELL